MLTTHPLLASPGKNFLRLRSKTGFQPVFFTPPPEIFIFFTFYFYISFFSRLFPSNQWFPAPLSTNTWTLSCNSAHTSAEMVKMTKFSFFFFLFFETFFRTFYWPKHVPRVILLALEAGNADLHRSIALSPANASHKILADEDTLVESLLRLLGIT